MSQEAHSNTITIHELHSGALGFIAFVAGGVLFSMDWITPVLKSWLVALVAGGFVYWIITISSIQQFIEKYLRASVVKHVLIWGVPLAVFIISGLLIMNSTVIHTDKEQLQTTAETLIQEITTFNTDTTALEPKVTSSYWASPDIAFQAISDYQSMTEDLFVNRYHQRITDLGYELFQHNIISQDELNQLNWFNTTEQPVIQWILQALEEYNSRLK